MGNPAHGSLSTKWRRLWIDTNHTELVGSGPIVSRYSREERSRPGRFSGQPRRDVENAPSRPPAAPRRRIAAGIESAGQAVGGCDSLRL